MSTSEFLEYEERTGDPRWVDWARRSLAHLEATQNRSDDPISRGDWWARWGVLGGEEAAALGRPAQFIYQQSRPLVPGTTLAYAPAAMALIARQEGWELP